LCYVLIVNKGKKQEEQIFLIKPRFQTTEVHGKALESGVKACFHQEISVIILVFLLSVPGKVIIHLIANNSGLEQNFLLKSKFNVLIVVGFFFLNFKLDQTKVLFCLVTDE